MVRKPLLACLCIWLLCAGAASYIRLYPLWGHIWSPGNEQATLAVIFNLKKTLLLQVHRQYPQLSPEQADRLASEKLNQTLHDENARVRRAIEQVSGTMSRQNGMVEPIYLLESDPFYFYNLTENIATKGRMADTVKGNKYFNPLMGAPFGYWQPLSLHPYVGFSLYKFLQAFNPHIPLMSAVAFVPLVITALGLLAFIWCGRLFGLGFPAILTGCFYFAMAPIFLKRSSLGWYDTDPYNLLFPFIFLGIFFKAVNGLRPIRAAIALALTLLLYSLIWQGWIFLFFMTLICAGAAAVFAFFIRKDPALTRAYALLAGTFLVVTAAAGLAIYGMDFFSFFGEGAGELAKFTVKGMGLWPNLFLEVGELKRSSGADLLSDTGGPVFLLGAGLGLIYAFKNLPKLKALLTALFLLITIVLSLKAERFVIFTLVPLSLLFACGVQCCAGWLENKKHGKAIAAAFVALLLALCWSNANKSIRTVLTPIFNSTWNDALTAIRDKTPADSIVNTWWPPGHFIKAIAHRRVPFDGASLSESQTGYWMANILLETDENRARGLLRMLNSSGNRPMEFLTQLGLGVSDSVALLNDIASQTPMEAWSTAIKILGEDDIGDDAAERLLLLTHGGTPHSYVLVYNELVEQNVGLVFVARRDLRKIEAINADANLLSSVPKPDSPEFINFLWELSGGPAKYSPPLSLVSQDADALVFTEGLNVKRDLSAATINSAQYGRGIPLGVITAKDGRLAENNFPDGRLNYMVVLYEQDGQPACRLMDRSLAESLLIKMFFFNGAGLKYFKPFTFAHDPTGRTQIKVFEVEWDK